MSQLEQAVRDAIEYLKQAYKTIPIGSEADENILCGIDVLEAALAQQEKPHPSCKSETLVNRGALTLALNSLKRGTQSQIEIAKELEMTVQHLEKPEPVVLSEEWTACLKLPVIVHVRKQRENERHISTREGITPVKLDDLIMRGISGEEYPIGRDIWEKTYTTNLNNTQPPRREWVGLMRGVRVDGENVVISVKSGNDGARALCGELLKELNT